MQLDSAAAPSPIHYGGAIFPPPTFASINPSGPGATMDGTGKDAAQAVRQDALNKGPFYSTPLGTSGLIGTTKRRSYPGTLVSIRSRYKKVAPKSRKEKFEKYLYVYRTHSFRP